MREITKGIQFPIIVRAAVTSTVVEGCDRVRCLDMNHDDIDFVCFGDGQGRY